jgi:hypothetical protein
VSAQGVVEPAESGWLDRADPAAQALVVDRPYPLGPRLGADDRAMRVFLEPSD